MGGVERMEAMGRRGAQRVRWQGGGVVRNGWL